MELSIIIPAYNVEKYICECVDSVLSIKAESFEYEVILVNDGSTDSTFDIIQKYSDNPHIRIITKENGGLSSARNAGIAIAKGDYLAFIDSDDYIDPDEFEMFVINVIRDGVDVGFGNLRKVFTDETPVRAENRPLSKKTGLVDGYTYLNDHYDYFKDDIPVEVVTQLYSSSFLRNNKLVFKEGLLHEDMLFTMQLFMIADKVKYYPIVFYNYRMRHGSIMHNITEANYRSIWIIVNDLYARCVSSACTSRAVHSILINLLFEASKGANIQVNRVKVKEMLKSLKATTPRSIIKKILLLVELR